MNSVRLYCVELPTSQQLLPLDLEVLECWLAELSPLKQQAVRRLINDSDRQASLIGSRLLKLCAQHEEIKGFLLSDVVYPDNGKPYWPGAGEFDFNISHSGQLVVAAACRSVKVGVDIERHRQLNNLNFKMVMSAEELTRIKLQPALFFGLWSKKEAVVKAADTTGIARMRDVQLDGMQAELDGVRWYLNKVELQHEGYSACLASSAPVDELIIRQVSIEELF